MNRNVLYIVIGVVAIVAIFVIYQVYQDRQKTGVDISIGKSGISIEKK
ncbi:MAG: hypothetical protein AB7G15_16770 [Alphaproteobacteria bacterium]